MSQTRKQDQAIEFQPDIVVLHDFVLDHYVTFRPQLSKFLSQVAGVAGRGGGNIVVNQYLSRGGKAANLASALARLGARAHLIARTSRFGRQLAEMFLKPAGVDTSCVRADGRLALTVSLEMSDARRPINIMLSDPGSNGNFSFSDIGAEELKLIRNADGVALADWALNSKGTDLAEGVFRHMGRKKLLLIDPGDVSRRQRDVNGLIKKVLLKGYGILSVNESEALCIAESLRGRRITGNHASPESQGATAAAIISSELGVRVDLHTRLFSASFEDDCYTASPTYRVKIRRVTGAGDSWNAGNIYAECVGLPDGRRLEFANALAAYYISNPRPDHPTRKMVEGFIYSWRNRKRDSEPLRLDIAPSIYWSS